MAKRLYHLEEAGNARGRFRMANVGLDRADQEWLLPPWTAIHHGAQRLDLDGIAKGPAVPWASI